MSSLPQWQADTLALRRQLLLWYRKNNRQLPWRQLFKASQDPYHVWLSEIMLQQTVIKAVIPAYERFLATFPTVKDLALAKEEDIRLACRGLGYYRRFGFLHRAAKELVERSSDGGKTIPWPTTFKDWMELPGIGRYTAAAISSIAFNARQGVVDGNVERVFCRLMDIRRPPNDPELKPFFYDIVDDLVDPKAPGDFNQALMELGQLVCTKTHPGCAACPIRGSCKAFVNKSQHLAPQDKVKRAFEDIAMRLYISEKKGRIALRQRPDNARFLKGHLGMPTALQRDGEWLWDGAADTALEGKVVGTFKHSITHHKIHVTVIRADVKDKDLEWIPMQSIQDQLVTSLDKKAWVCFKKAGAPTPLFS